VAAEVRAAGPLTDELLETLRVQLHASLGKEVDLQVETDPNLIAGMVVRVGDTVYDGSVVNRLKQLRQEALDRATREIRSGLDRFTRSN
jgi:F-type H+-transporting ATPase subunit delta